MRMFPGLFSFTGSLVTAATALAFLDSTSQAQVSAELRIRMESDDQASDLALVAYRGRN